MTPIYFANADTTMLRSYNVAAIEKAFKYIAQESAIEFRYPQGGCQQRAQIMSLILEHKFNIEHCKLWLFAPAALMFNNTQTLYINDFNNFTENNVIEWNYHVVPVVNLNTGNSIELRVIDPSLDNKNLLTLNSFFSLIGNSHVSKYTFLLPDKYFFNTSCINGLATNLFDGSFSNFTGQAKDDLTTEKGIALNDMAIQIFEKYIKTALSNNTNQTNNKVADLKAIFGNASVLDLVFAQNISGDTENTKLRYALSNYSDIMREARSIFFERLMYWTNFTNNLLNKQINS